MKDSTRLKKNPDVITRTIEDETILMPLYRTSEEIDCIYTLNRIGARIWQLIDGKRNLAKMRELLMAEFDVRKEKMNQDLAKFLKDLKEIKAILG